MRWFGKPGGAPYEADCPHAPTPTGKPCGWCGEVFTAEDDGVLMPLLKGNHEWEEMGEHYECHLRSVIGGLNHLKGRCICCGGTEPPDPTWLTLRQAAIAAVAEWEKRR